jgi:membrane dipeptidase
MHFADAHSDLGVLIHLAEEGLMPRELADTYFEQMKRGHVVFSLVQLGGDFDHEGVDLRESRRVLGVLESVLGEVEQQDWLELVQWSSQLEALHTTGRSGVVLSLEGCSSIDPEFKTLETLHDSGLRMFALTHNGPNIYACGCEVKNDTGLTRLGEQLLDRGHELGLILDLVHIGERSFWDALEYTSQPVFVSHSNSKGIYVHMRNISDEQIMAIAERGGIVALNFLSEFMDDSGGPVRLERFLDHLEHMVGLTSIKHVALGPDFYCYMMPELEYVGGLDNPSLLSLLSDALSESGYSEEEAELVCWRNLQSFLERNLPEVPGQHRTKL